MAKYMVLRRIVELDEDTVEIVKLMLGDASYTTVGRILQAEGVDNYKEVLHAAEYGVKCTDD